jgi:hypothetical protein
MKLNIQGIDPKQILRPSMPVILDRGFSNKEKEELILQVMDNYAAKVYRSAYGSGLRHNHNNGVQAKALREVQGFLSHIEGRVGEAAFSEIWNTVEQALK